MLPLTPHSRLFLAVPPVDFRKGIDGLTALCRQTLNEHPLGGAVSVFRHRTGTTLKLLASEGQGFWLCTNRLSQGRFPWWPTAATPRVTLSAQELSILFWNGNPERAQLAPLWRPVPYDGTSAAG
jgi:transposase